MASDYREKSKEVAAITGYSLHWIYELVQGYNRLGPDSLGDKRQENHDRTPLLNDEQQAQLWAFLQSAPADGGIWGGPKGAQWMSELLDRPVAPQRGWDYQCLCDGYVIGLLMEHYGNAYMDKFSLFL